MTHYLNNVLSANSFNRFPALLALLLLSLLSPVFSAFATTKFDYDGDGKADIGIRRAEQQIQFIRSSGSGETNSFEFGSQAGDVPISGDFDGDDITDFGVRRAANSTWYILNSSGIDARDGNIDGITQLRFGMRATDIPVPADYDGDGITDIAVRRPTNQFWYIINSSGVDNISGNNDGITRFQFGRRSDDIPVPADYDGDGKADLAVRRPSNQYWYILNSSGTDNITGASDGISRIRFGKQETDIPVPADYDGDGKADLAVRRPSNQYWYILNSSGKDNISGASDGISRVRFGKQVSDIPVPADYDGDGRADIAVRRPSRGIWYIQNTSGIDTISNYSDGITRLQFSTEADDIALSQSAAAIWFASDIDEDGLNYTEEQDAGTDINNPDTDGDGLNDRYELLTSQTDPLNNDSDNDGLQDGEELNDHNTDPKNSDSDGDGLLDGDEVNIHQTDPNSTDSDNDGLSDAEEVSLGTDPNNSESPIRVTSEITSDLTGMMSIESASGFVTALADVYQFDEDNNGKVYRNQSSQLLSFASDFNWSINNAGTLIVEGFELNQGFAICNSTILSSHFSEEIVTQVNLACSQGLFENNQIDMLQGVSKENWTLLEEQGNSLKFIVETEITRQLIIPQEVIDNIIGGWNIDPVPTSVITLPLQHKTLFSEPATDIDVIDASSLTGDWVLPLFYTDPVARTTGTISNFMYDRITVSGGTANGRLSELNFDINFTDNAFVLNNDEESFVYRPWLQLENQYTFMLEYQINGITQHIYAASGVQVNTSGSGFIDHLVTALPQVYSASINHTLSTQRLENGLPDVTETMFAYQFRGDNTLRRGISIGTTNSTPYPNLATPHFYSTQDWTYSVDHNSNSVITSLDEDFRIRNRYWDVLSINSHGVVQILEYENWTVDTDFDGTPESVRRFIQPRIGFLELLDLSEYPEIWGNSDFDNDGLTNSQEIALGTDINNSDTDNDGLSDGEEVNNYSTDPLNGDSDGDGLSDFDEIRTHNTDPNKSDTDGDGISDFEEVNDGTDPNDSNSPLFFTASMINNSRGIIARDLADGFGTGIDDVLVFNDDNTGTFYDNASNGRVDYTPIRWSINNDGVLVIENEFIDVGTLPCFSATISEYFNQEIVEHMDRACSQGLFSNNRIPVHAGIIEEQWEINKRTSTHLGVNVTPIYYLLLEIPASVISNILGGWTISLTPFVYIEFSTTEKSFFTEGSEVMSPPLASDLVGDWVMPSFYQLPIGQIIGNNIWFRKTFFQERFTIENGVATGKTSGLTYDVSFSDTGFSFSRDNEELIYTPVWQSENQYGAIIEYLVNGVTNHLYADNIVQVTDNASELIANMLTELPEAYNAALRGQHKHQRDEAGVPLPEHLLAHHFSDDGSMKFGILYADEANEGSDNGQDFPYFYVGQERQYSVDRNNNIITSIYDGGDNVRDRKWEVLSVNTQGVYQIFEYAKINLDTISDEDDIPDTEYWFIEPRLNYFQAVDLSYYTEGWQNSNLNSRYFPDSDASELDPARLNLTPMERVHSLKPLESSATDEANFLSDFTLSANKSKRIERSVRQPD